ncbi:MAG: MoxR family ATPase [Verrucomicrobia bacterium]|nr:MoxR family ATPase [Verrucomicrobiota bacterium]MCH8525598.1 MoxR family ATPase [Kiritimatiellia bacterium]
MSDDIQTAKRLAEVNEKLKEALAQVIVGQDAVLEQLLIGLFANQHCFMVGVPGLAKTLMVSTLARLLDMRFKRIQFTPDLMPSDITGTDVMQEDPETGRRVFEFAQGPIFTNMLLADEINRTPPKTQAALLEAMQERQVTAGNHTYPLAKPFFVLATQNPIEQEGTYPLPEAQLDRFMLSIHVEYPQRHEELEILRATTAAREVNLTPILHADEILELQQVVRRVPVGEHVFEYTLDLVRQTRPGDKSAPDYVREWLDVGSGPRAGQNLVLGAKARALMHGRTYATCEDVAYLAAPVLRHRMVTNFNAESEGVSPDDIVKRILDSTPKRKES